MDTLRQAFRINVGFLINAEIGYFREFDFNIESYRDDDLHLRDLEGIVKISRTQQGLFFEGNFKAKVELECSRCLVNYLQEINFEFAELFSFTQENVTESNLIVPDTAQIELAEIIREYAFLSFPIQPKCSEDCKGLCVVCGQNLNIADCGHRPEPLHTFSKLKELLHNVEEKGQESE